MPNNTSLIKTLYKAIRTECKHLQDTKGFVQFRRAYNPTQDKPGYGANMKLSDDQNLLKTLIPSMRSSLETSNPPLKSLLRLVREEFDAYKNTKDDEMVVAEGGADTSSSSKRSTLINYRIDRGFECIRALGLQRRMRLSSSDTVSQGLVRVQCTSFYQGKQEFIMPGDIVHGWVYRIRISNIGSSSDMDREKNCVQLLSREWNLVDEKSKNIERNLIHRSQANARGAVGETPLLYPGDGFEYCSWVTSTKIGLCMEGSFQMSSDGAGEFDAIVSPFPLLTKHIETRL